MQKQIATFVFAILFCAALFAIWEKHRPEPDEYGEEAGKIVDSLIVGSRWEQAGAFAVTHGKMQVTIMGNVTIDGVTVWIFNARERREIGKYAASLLRRLQRDAVRKALY